MRAPRAFGLALSLGLACLAQGQLTQEELVQRYRTIAQAPLSLALFEQLGDREGETEQQAAERMFAVAEARLRALGVERIERRQLATPGIARSSGGSFEFGESVTLHPIPHVFEADLDVERKLTAVWVEGPAGRWPAVDGKLAVMPFGSGRAWLEALRRGAAAVVLDASAPSDRWEWAAKHVDAPIAVPVAVALGPAGSAIRSAAKGGRTGFFKLKARSTATSSTYLEALLPGSDAAVASEPVMLLAHVDSGLPFGVEGNGWQARAGLAAAVEIAAWFSRHPARRPIRLVLIDGHHGALAGERALAAEMIEGRLASPRVLITLDLSTGSDRLAAFSQGDFYRYRPEARDRSRRGAGSLRAQLDHIRPHLGLPEGRFFDAVNESDGRPWTSLVTGGRAMGCEPFQLAGIPTWTFATVDDARPMAGTPWDTRDAFSPSKWAAQTRLLLCLLQLPLNQSLRDQVGGPPTFPVDPPTVGRRSLIAGFSRLDGRAVHFDPRRSFLADAPVASARLVVPGQRLSLAGVRGDLVALADDQGRFRLEGLAPSSAYFILHRRMTSVFAYAGGPQPYASTLGDTGGGQFESTFMLNAPVKTTPVVMAPLRPRLLVGAFDPRDLAPFERVRLLDPRTRAAPLHGFTWSPAAVRKGEPAMPVAAAFVPDGDPVLALLSGASPGVRGVAEIDPAGEGPIDVGPSSARWLDRRNAELWRTFEPYRILPASLRSSSGADASPEVRWAEALRLHPVLAATAGDVLFGVLFYLFVLAPFSVICERVWVAAARIGPRLGWTLGFFLAGLAGLSWAHPAFSILRHPLVIFVAFAMLALSVAMAVFLIGRLDHLARPSSASAAHGGGWGTAAALALGSMRRRRLRSTLTALTFVGLTVTILSFTSIVPEYQISSRPSPSRSEDTGLFFRAPGYDMLPWEVLDRIGGAKVQPVVWAYAGDAEAIGVMPCHSVRGESSIRGVSGIVELPGVGPITPGHAVLPASVAKALATAGGDTIVLQGLSLRVQEIVPDEQLKRSAPLDGSSWMPADFATSRGIRQVSGAEGKAFRTFVHLEPGACLVTDPATAIRLGGALRAVRLPMPETETATQLQAWMPRLDVNVYGRVPGPNGFEIRQFSALVGRQASGFDLAGLMVLLSILFAANTLVAGVHERRRELAIFSALGMPPRAIARIFVAEALAYGVLGILAGYFVAQGFGSAAQNLGLGGLVFNFSATSALGTALLVGLAALVSTIYPARLAVRLSAPAFEPPQPLESGPDRHVRILPFSIGPGEDEEALGVLTQWLGEATDAAGGEIVAEDVHVQPDRLEARVWVAPFDVGLNMQLQIALTPSDEPEVRFLRLTFERRSGDASSWRRGIDRFTGLVQSRLLRWRAGS